MKKNNNNITVVINLPRKFVNVLEEDIKDEINIAKKKWEVTLSESQVKKVHDSAVIQLEGKVTAIAKTPWKMTDQTVSVVINAKTLHLSEPVTFVLPRDRRKPFDTKFVKANYEWIVEDDPVEETVPLSEFYERFMHEIRTWARTATFYSVGSYSY